MPPKTTVGPDEDVKFLLTVIKQLSGTVSIPASPKPTRPFANSLSQPDWQKVSDELGLPSKGAA